MLEYFWNGNVVYTVFMEDYILILFSHKHETHMTQMFYF